MAPKDRRIAAACAQAVDRARNAERYGDAYIASCSIAKPGDECPSPGFVAFNLLVLAEALQEFPGPLRILDVLLAHKEVLPGDVDGR